MNEHRGRLAAKTRRFGCAAIVLALAAASSARAQSQNIAELKGKIFDARMAKQMLANGLKFCGELDGTNFYFAPRDRVLNLEDYHRSLRNLAVQHSFNPETRRPWTEQDAAARWTQVQQQASKDKAACALAASLPALEKELDQLQKQSSAASDKKD